MQLQTTQIRRLVGADVIDRSGDKVGTVDEIWQDTRTGEPEWAEVSTGLFGGKHTMVPLSEATLQDGSLRLPHEKAVVKDAPRLDLAGDKLSQDQERALYGHYGMSYAPPDAAAGQAPAGERRAPAQGVTGDDRTSARGRTADDDAMTRSEEEVVVGTEAHETGRVRLRKYVVTEDVETTVPVRREEVRLEREPITEANRDQALAGPEISESEHEVVLHAEEPVVGKRTVPKERVRLDKTTRVEEAKVAEQARQERIEVEGMDDPTARPPRRS